MLLPRANNSGSQNDIMHLGMWYSHLSAPVRGIHTCQHQYFIQLNMIHHRKQHRGCFEWSILNTQCCCCMLSNIYFDVFSETCTLLACTHTKLLPYLYMGSLQDATQFSDLHNLIITHLLNCADHRDDHREVHLQHTHCWSTGSYLPVLVLYIK